MDPLIRKINNNLNIKTITFKSPINENQTQNKTHGFADDVATTIKNCSKSLNELFKEYEKFTKISGITLNAEKTEIISTTMQKYKFVVNYMNNKYKIETINKLKICGKTFSYDSATETKENIEDKIIKLEKQLQMWKQRNLSLEGKINIVKTFGLSQVIYSMQNTYFPQQYISKIEKIIYKFIWSKSHTDVATERIKRTTLKNDYIKGGLKAPDVGAIDLSLKTKNLLNNINNPESDTAILYDHYIYTCGNKQRNSMFYRRNQCKDKFIDEGLKGINTIYYQMIRDLSENLETDTKISRRYADIIASTNLENYEAPDEISQLNLNIMITKGFYNFNFIHNCIKFPTSDKYIFRNNGLKNSLPEIWFKVMEKFNTRNINTLLKPLDYIFCETNKFKTIGKIKTSDLRKLYTNIITTVADHEKIKSKLQLTEIPLNAFIINRRLCHSTKYRQTQYRILHNDIFTKSKLFQIKMVDSPLCERCLKKNKDEIEDLNHLLFKCPTSQDCWKMAAELLTKITKIKVELDKNKILFGLKLNDHVNFKGINTIIMRITHNFIQIERPKKENWKIRLLIQIKEIINCEKMFLSEKNFNNKWSSIEHNVNNVTDLTSFLGS